MPAMRFPQIRIFHSIDIAILRRRERWAPHIKAEAISSRPILCADSRFCRHHFAHIALQYKQTMFFPNISRNYMVFINNIVTSE
jgi:hypothetical protein